jgi:hypothetical protein
MHVGSKQLKVGAVLLLGAVLAAVLSGWLLRPRSSEEPALPKVIHPPVPEQRVAPVPAPTPTSPRPDPAAPVPASETLLAAMAAEMGGVVVRCPELPTGSQVMFGVPKDREGSFPRQVDVSEGEFLALPGPRVGRVLVPGDRSAKVSWSAGANARCELSETVYLTGLEGTVLGPDGSPVGGAAVAGCGGYTLADAGGDFLLEVPVAGRCLLAASGGRDAWGSTVEVTPVAGQDVAGLVLTVPSTDPPPTTEPPYLAWRNCMDNAAVWAMLDAAWRVRHRSDPDLARPVPPPDPTCARWLDGGESPPPEPTSPLPAGVVGPAEP